MALEGALEVFYAECQELLESMEHALLRLDEGECDDEILNEIFRSAHTIKGSAGIFSLDHIVDFTHVVENVLDRARDHEIKLESDLLNIIFRCRDHIAQLISFDADEYQKKPDLAETGKALLDSLSPWVNESDGDSLDFQAAVDVSEEGDVGDGNWHISLRLSEDCLKNGMDPMSFIHFLNTIGTIEYIETLSDGLPDIAEFDPETLYLAYEISLYTSAGRDEIEGAFTFVQEDSLIRILPPSSKVEEYVKLIQELPESDQRLGEILVKCGAISVSGLEQALSIQVHESLSSGVSRRIGDVLVQENVIPEKVVDAAVEKQQKAGDKKQASQLIRIDAERLDHLINLIGELVINRQRVDVLAAETRHEPLIESVDSLGEFTEQLRDAALNLRMVQIGSTFQKFKRIVRDTAQELGKEINLVLEGTETELDRLMVEKLSDPLTHIVRNAIDHGIESTEQRRESGKNEAGTLKMSAYHDAGHIVIEVSDDGGGIVPEKIRAKAIDKGIIDGDSSLPENEILQLVFHPGFSTAESVTNLSGRGVGMDVVKRNVESLQGFIDIQSQVGLGTRFRIRLPLTLAIIDGFHVQSGNTHFIVPQASVIECTDLSAHEDLVNRNCINLRGDMIPYLKLSESFQLNEVDSVDSEIAKPSRKLRSDNVVIVQFGESRAGIVADVLHGEIQTVVKPLGPIFKPLKGIGGSSLLGNGDIAFILDIPQLIESVITIEEKES